MKRYTANEILDAREKRGIFIEDLINKYKESLISIRVNYPGSNKNNDICSSILEIFDDIINGLYGESIIFRMFETSADGPSLFIIIEEEAASLKRKMMEIEEKHFLGRIIDIDVIDKNNKKISRNQFGYENRKCFLCGDDSRVCARLSRHSNEQLIKYINDRYREYTENFYENS